MRPATAQVLFWIFAALIGLSLGSIFMVYTHTSIVRVFFITAASFGALSLWGYTTQRDLSGMGSFLIMGLFGVILASLVNLFLAELGAAVRDLGGRRAGVRGPDRLGHPAAEERVSLRRDGRRDARSARRSSGALSLYLNFINLFTLLLQLLGTARRVSRSRIDRRSRPRLRPGPFCWSATDA